MGPIFLVRPQVAQYLAVEHRQSLYGLQRQCAVSSPHTSERLCDPILDAQLLIESWNRGQAGWCGTPALQPRAPPIIGKFGLIADEGTIAFRRAQSAVPGPRHIHDDRQPPPSPTHPPT